MDCDEDAATGPMTGDNATGRTRCGTTPTRAAAGHDAERARGTAITDAELVRMATRLTKPGRRT